MITFKQFIYGAIPYYYTRIINPKSDKLVYFKYIKDNYYTHFPTYDFVSEYFSMQIDVFYDRNKKMNYVNHKGRKLYFPRHLSKEKIEKKYKALLIEQDVRYPHCYVKSIQEFQNKTLLDIGSAEGMTSLEAIEVVNHIYIFEFEKEWIEALEATFEPWKDKITIIQKYISDTTNNHCETLDNFLGDKPIENLFLKMDIEGEEYKALNGARNVFAQASGFNFAICTYHKKKI